MTPPAVDESAVVPIEAARSRRDYPAVELRRVAREHHRLSLSTVAEVAGTDEDVLVMWEAGQGTLPREVFERYTALLDGLTAGARHAR